MAIDEGTRMGCPPKAPAERRRARTADPLVALSRLFESVRRDGSLEAVVLADEMGLAIAGAGTASLCDELAAQAAVLTAARPANDTVPSRLDVVTRAAKIRRLRIDGIEVLLCAEGDSFEGENALARAADGCQRILARGRRASALDQGCPDAREANDLSRFTFAERRGAT